MIPAKDLTKEPPRSPRTRVGGYAILGRAIDKGRALLEGEVGEYHFDCPLDNMLFDFKGVKGEQVKELLEKGSSDEEITSWLDSHGEKKSADEVKAWSDQMEAARPYDNPEKKEWFSEQCKDAKIDPAQSTLFDWLEADDRLSHSK